MKLQKVPLRTTASIRYPYKPRLGRFVTPLLRSAVKSARPIAKRTLKELGREGIKTAASAAGDALMKDISLKLAAKQNWQKSLPTMKKTALVGVKRAADKLTGTKSIKRKRGGESFPRR